MAKIKDTSEEVSREVAATEANPEAKVIKVEEPRCGTCANRRGEECHFMPPQVTSAVFAAWAPVKETDWCRQWEAK